MREDRTKAWSHYYTTGDTTPLCKAYGQSINSMAWEYDKRNQEDMFQIGMMGLLKAIRRIDLERVKSVDAWVFLNVRGMMRNARRFPTTDRIDWLTTVPATEDELYDGMTDHLPAREALILRLIHVQKYKRTEVAKMFGLSSMRIGQLEQRALGMLREEISLN